MPALFQLKAGRLDVSKSYSKLKETAYYIPHVTGAAGVLFQSLLFQDVIRSH